MGNKGKSSSTLLVIILILGGLWVAGVFGPSPISNLNLGGTGLGGTQSAQTISCPSGIANLQGPATYRNIRNASYDGIPVTFLVTKASDPTTVVTTASSTYRTAVGYDTITIPCNPETYGDGFILYSEGSSSAVAVKYPQALKFVKNGVASTSTESVTLEGSRATTCFLQALDVNSNNDTFGPNGATVDRNTQAIAQNGAFSGILQINATGATGAQCGAGDQVFFSVNSSSSKFGPKDISLQSDTPGYALTEVDCAAYPLVRGQRNAQRCYVGATPAAGQTINIRFSGSPTLGNPTVTDSPMIFIDDLTWARDTSGKVIYSAFDSGGTNLGVAVEDVYIALS